MDKDFYGEEILQGKKKACLNRSNCSVGVVKVANKSKWQISPAEYEELQQIIRVLVSTGADYFGETLSLQFEP